MVSDDMVALNGRASEQAAGESSDATRSPEGDTDARPGQGCPQVGTAPAGHSMLLNSSDSIEGRAARNLMGRTPE